MELKKNIFAEDDEDRGAIVGPDGLPVDALDGDIEDNENVLAQLGNVKLLEQELKMKLDDGDKSDAIKAWELKFAAWRDDRGEKPGPHPDPNHDWNTHPEEWEYDDEDEY